MSLWQSNDFTKQRTSLSEKYADFGVLAQVFLTFNCR